MRKPHIRLHAHRTPQGGVRYWAKMPDGYTIGLRVAPFFLPRPTTDLAYIYREIRKRYPHG